ncbi:MAG: 4-hydroxythreonine-4-phosphate dehydrogenase PdxA [Bacteroidales bacterium]|nr:4-hydroxythreonine-4-phosphate dehydrogenase PdxA [Bacteroidales bacterium]
MSGEKSVYKIGITHGDLNGISYEVIMKALADAKMLDICIPIVYGLSKVAGYYKKNFQMQDFSFQYIKNPSQASLKKANLINLSESEVPVNMGESTPVAGKYAEMALRYACNDLKNKNIDALVTAPINKNNIQSEQFHFTGHTEYLASVFGAENPLMMMISPAVKVAFVTNHLPLQEVAKNISKGLIINKIKILHKTLIQDFGSTNPKIAVLSLNPHAGDKGLLGQEEENIIAPAIREAFDQHINAFGPYPADGLFGSGNYSKFDAVLAMYHDQGMAPFKILADNEGVNYTAGLPIVRTSPAHGTGYDIAGKNCADEQSLRSAIYLAIDILRNRNQE